MSSADIPPVRAEIPPSIVHPSKDLFTAVDLQPLYARFVKAPVNPGSYPRTFVSDLKLESRRGSNVADGSAPATPGGKDGSSANEKDGIRSPAGGSFQIPLQKGQQNQGNQKKPPKVKLFSSVYEELLQEIPGESSENPFVAITAHSIFVADPVPLPPNESLLDIPYHRYPNHLDDPNFQFASLITSDKAKMALRLQVGHAQGVNGNVSNAYRQLAHADSVLAVCGWHEERRQEREPEAKGKFAHLSPRPQPDSQTPTFARNESETRKTKTLSNVRLRQQISHPPRLESYQQLPRRNIAAP